MSWRLSPRREQAFDLFRDDDINLEPYELGREFGEAFAAPFSPPVLDRDRATIDPTEFAQPLRKSCDPFARGRIRAPTQESDGRQLRLLCASRDRPSGCSASNERDELAPLQLVGLHQYPCQRRLRRRISNWQRLVSREVRSTSISGSNPGSQAFPGGADFVAKVFACLVSK